MMQDLIALLEQKQDWFAKFLKITRGYYAQLQSNPDGAIADVDYFLNNRQSLLNIIDATEKKITQFIKLNKIKLEDLAANRATWNVYSKQQEAAVKELRDLDERILRVLSRAKDESKEQLTLVTRGKRALSGYRQENTESSKVDVQR